MTASRFVGLALRNSRLSRELIRISEECELRAAAFNAGLDDAEIQDDAERVAEALTSYCPRTEATGEIFAAFTRILRKARRSPKRK